MWWIAGQRPSEQPISDWIEMDMVRYLQQNPGCSFAEIDRALCAMSRGCVTFLKPGAACAELYAELMEPDHKGLRLRNQDSPVTRHADLLAATGLLEQIGIQLGMQVEGELPVLWKGKDGRLEYAYYPISSSLISRFVFTSPYPPEKCLIVLPGSRSNLVTYKLRENPLLANAVGHGWRLLKFRHLRALADNPLLNKESWALQLENDPPEYKPAQLDMF